MQVLKNLVLDRSGSNFNVGRPYTTVLHEFSKDQKDSRVGWKKDVDG